VACAATSAASHSSGNVRAPLFCVQVASCQVTADEAKAFLAETAQKHRAAQVTPAPAAKADEPDDFDDME